MATRRRTYGTGTVYYDEEWGKWVGSISVGRNPRTGNRSRRKVSGDTRKEVEQRLRDLRDRLRDGEQLTGQPTVAAMYDRWMKREVLPDRSPATVAMYRSLATQHLLPVLGTRTIESLTVDDVEDWLDARGELSTSTVRRLRSLLAQVIDVAVRRRAVTVNVARIATMPTNTKPAKRGRSLTLAEAQALLAAADGHRLGAFVDLALHTGSRPGELAALTWDRVDLEEGVVTFIATKTNTVRSLRLSPATVAALEAHRERTTEERRLMGGRWPPSDLVFTTEAGTMLDRSNLRRFIRKLADEAGIEWSATPYTLRHSTGSLLAAEGVHIEALKDRLGQRDSRTTSRYYIHPTTRIVETGSDLDLR